MSSPDGPVLSSFDLDGIVGLFNRGKIHKNSVIVLVGAGMSTAAGIPDFRSPNSGIYANLGKYKLPQPEMVFEINYFKVSARKLPSSTALGQYGNTAEPFQTKI